MRESILLIEDEPALQSTLGLRLRGEGYIVETANKGTEGFEKATTSPFDLIILCVMLPDRNGFDVQLDAPDVTRDHLRALEEKTEP